MRWKRSPRRSAKLRPARLRNWRARPSASGRSRRRSCAGPRPRTGARRRGRSRRSSAAGRSGRCTCRPTGSVPWPCSLRPMRVQQEQAVVAQAALRHLHVGLVVAFADMFEHAQADHRVELAVELPIVLQPEFDRQAVAQLAAQRDLPLRHGHADTADAVALGGETHQAAPAAADVEQRHAAPQPQLAADQVELVFLRLIERLARRSSSRRCRSCAGRASRGRNRCRGRSGAGRPARRGARSAG